MQAQSQIKRTLSRPESIDAVRRLLSDGAHASRSSLAQAACGHFGFIDARGHAQSAGCIKALRELGQECLRCYCLRWRIEDWHRVLKSGCRIEALQHKTAERLKRAIAINLVIAWRIMLMTLLGRQCPDLPAEVLFSDLEVEVLQAYAKKTAPAPPLCSAMQYA